MAKSTLPTSQADRQATKSLSLYRSAPASDSVESNTRKDALQAKVPWLAHQLKSGNSFSHGLLDAGSPENGFFVAENKPANLRQGTECDLETASSNEIVKGELSVVSLGSVVLLESKKVTAA